MQWQLPWAQTSRVLAERQNTTRPFLSEDMDQAGPVRSSVCLLVKEDLV